MKSTRGKEFVRRSRIQYIYIYILNSRRSPKIPDAAPRNVSSDPGPTLPLAKCLTHYLRHFGEAGRVFCERQRQCWVAGPIICGTSTKQVACFARESANAGLTDPLFTALRASGSRILRETVPGLGGLTHHLRHFGEAGRLFCESECQC